MSGWLALSSFLTRELYRGGEPPMCVIQTCSPSQVKCKSSGYEFEISASSMFPYTARTVLKSCSFLRTSGSPMSPACHISSTSSKCSNTFGSRKLWVSDRSPIFNDLQFLCQYRNHCFNTFEEIPNPNVFIWAVNAVVRIGNSDRYCRYSKRLNEGRNGL